MAMRERRTAAHGIRVALTAVVCAAACGDGSREGWDPFNHVPYPSDLLPEKDCRGSIACPCEIYRPDGTYIGDRQCPPGWICQCCRENSALCYCRLDSEPPFIYCCGKPGDCGDGASR